MAWSYHCYACGMNILAEDKRALTEKVMRHANNAHNMNLSYEQTRELIDRDAREETETSVT